MTELHYDGTALPDYEERAGRAARLVALVYDVLEREQQRWFLWLPVAMGAGIALYFKLPGEPSKLVSMLPLVVALVVAILVRRRALGLLVGAGLIAVGAGMAVIKIRTEIVRAPVLEHQLRNVEVHGWVVLSEPKGAGAQRLSLRVMSISGLARDRQPAKVRVTTRAPDWSLQPGDSISVVATIGPPGRPVLPGGYDFSRYAWYEQIGGVGYSRQKPRRVTAPEQAPVSLRFSAAIQRLRARIGGRVTAALPGEIGAIANALITGERGAITEATNQAFRASGLFHILSISGLHMVVMAGSIFVALRALLAMMPMVALRFGIKKWSAFGAALGALGYLMISGGSYATLRSWVMISIMFLAILLDRPALAMRNVALAALIILILYPESLLNAGFQMSFAAVVSLISAYEAVRIWNRGRRERTERSGVRQATREHYGPVAKAALFFAGIIASTIVASIAVAPFAAYHFHQSQQYAVLANLIAAPLCNIIVMPAALLTFLAMPLHLEAAPLWLMGKGIEGMVWCANVVASLPGAVGFVPEIPQAAFVAMLGGGLWLTLWRTRWRLLGLLPIALGLVLLPGKPRPDVLIGKDGQLVAARNHEGYLSILAPRGGNYEISRWLAADGDETTPIRISQATGARVFMCDGTGCTARVRGKLIAISRHPAALARDCATADIVVATLRVPHWCRPRTELPGIPTKDRVVRPAKHGLHWTAGRRPAVVIDRRDARTSGTHAVYIENAGIRIETVAQHQGLRPWSRKSASRNSGARNSGARNLGATSSSKRRRRPPRRRRN